MKLLHRVNILVYNLLTPFFLNLFKCFYESRNPFVNKMFLILFLPQNYSFKIITNMKEKLWFTCEVLEELRISYSTLFNVKRKLGMLSKDGSRKTRYSDEEVELIKQELKK
mgnify:CR=1 FL=1